MPGRCHSAGSGALQPAGVAHSSESTHQRRTTVGPKATVELNAAPTLTRATASAMRLRTPRVLATSASYPDRGTFARGIDRAAAAADPPDMVKYLRRQDGQTMPEYAVVLSLLTITTAAVFLALSGGVASAMTTVTGVI